MSISVALNSALSGLGAASRSAQTVSSNISNALTPGYVRRETDLATHQYGGVRVAGITRAVDPALLSERRLSGAEAGLAGTSRQALQRLSGLLGEIGAADSLPGRMAQLDAQLIEAASDPSSDARLTAVASTARGIADALNAASDGVQTVRADADRSIAGQVAALNAGLARIDELNAEILTGSVRGADTNGLKDLRQREIDTLSGIVPLREMARPNGGVALMSVGGTMLLDGSPAEIEFAPASGMDATAVPGAPLSGLSVNGRAVDMTREDGRMAGGTLAGAFAVRDEIAPEVQSRLDGFARDLMDRFTGVDGTIGPADPGLFTDDGGAFSGTETGLASRLTFNTDADPRAGGDIWKLRDGLGAAAPGPQGDGTLLNALRGALDTVAPATSPALGTARLTAGGQADALLSFVGGELFRAEARETYAQVRSSELIQQELEMGVDTDGELQTMMLVEQIYGANTKVIQAADSMLQRLMEI